MSAPDDPASPPSSPIVVRWLPGNRSTGVAATRLRCRLPARLLRQAGADSRLVRRREDPAAVHPDVLVVQDPCADHQAAAAARAAERGSAVVLDLSDPAWVGREPVRRVVEVAVAVAVRHGGLATKIDHRDVTAVDDAVEWTHPSPRIRPRPRPGEPARLVWFGVGHGPSAGTGLAELATLRPTLAAIARRRRFELIVVTDDRAGADELVLRSGIPGRSVDWSPWRLRSVLAAAHVCVLPAGATGAVRVRSANRAVTALVQGVPVVAGAVPAYRSLGGGVVAGSWETNIDRLLADQQAVEEQVGLGRDAVRRRFSDNRITDQWRSVISRVTASADRAAPLTRL